MLSARNLTILGALLLGGVFTVAFSGCKGGKDDSLNGGGSTFVYPMVDKWCAEYQKATEKKVNYTSLGSGAGIQQMIAETVDFGCTDGPMNDKQLEEAKGKNGEVVHIPLVMGAVVPAYNLKDLGKPLVLSGPVLANIYLGKITTWDDKAIQDLNPDLKDKLPAKKIAVCYRSDGSGTTYIWVDYLSKVSFKGSDKDHPDEEGWKEKVGVSTSVKFPVGIGAKGNEGVSQFVEQNDGAIGYVELIYALGNKIPFAKVKNKEGNDIEASLETVSAAASNGLGNIPDDLRYSLTNMPGKDSYPISGTVWAVVYVKQPAVKAEALKKFLTWVTHDGQQFCEPLHYAKLPKGLVEKAEKKIAMIAAK